MSVLYSWFRHWRTRMPMLERTTTVTTSSSSPPQLGGAFLEKNSLTASKTGWANQIPAGVNQCPHYKRLGERVSRWDGSQPGLCESQGIGVGRAYFLCLAGTLPTCLSLYWPLEGLVLVFCAHADLISWAKISRIDLALLERDLGRGRRWQEMVKFCKRLTVRGWRWNRCGREERLWFAKKFNGEKMHNHPLRNPHYT